ncbi:hypothetical protein LOY46_12250 [Pseudomonas sichuanensis]|uniref:hypothetical protein n=1 Tax=Pseudomonas sichuanensis TaxID=2213015 RepID=UPI00215F6899|nr:hypothetical protein [Pseudomonas sichuanensis]UVK85413.1 hypothetical protein LOY46_12250 [Pseudomonas sichuanensis]
MIQVRPVLTRRDLDAFIELPFRLYADDPLWVPPLRRDMRRQLSPRHNPVFGEAQIALFIACDEQGEVVGRISTCVHHAYNARFGDEHAFFGFFETCARREVGAALLEAACQWARSHGKQVLSGPYSFTPNQDAALLLENLDGRAPTLLQTYNPLWYAQVLADQGFEQAFTFSTYGTEVAAAKPRRERDAEDLLPGRQVHVRQATAADLKGGLEEIRQLFNNAFEGNHEVTPLTPASFRFLVDSMRAFVDLQGVEVVEVDGEPMAFFVVLPDLNQILQRLGGRLRLLDLLRLGRYRRAVDGAVIALIGASSQVQGGGLGRLLALRMRRYVQQRYARVDTMWIDDRNPSSYVLARNIGMQRTKRYGVFRRVLAPSFE